ASGPRASASSSPPAGQSRKRLPETRALAQSSVARHKSHVASPTSSVESTYGCAERRGSDSILSHLNADARGGRHGDRAVGGDLDRRFDQIGLEVAFARGDVARQREIRKRREMNVGGASDSRLEHAAVPDRNSVRGAQIVEPYRFGESADAARFDVDDAACAHPDRDLAVA